MKIIIQEENNDTIEFVNGVIKEVKNLVGNSINVELQKNYKKDSLIPSIDSKEFKAFLYSQGMFGSTEHNRICYKLLKKAYDYLQNIVKLKDNPVPSIKQTCINQIQEAVNDLNNIGIECSFNPNTLVLNGVETNKEQPIIPKDYKLIHQSDEEIVFRKQINKKCDCANQSEIGCHGGCVY